MQKLLFLKHVPLERGPIGIVPTSKNQCPLPGNYGFRFQFQVDQTLKDSWISRSLTTVERNACLKNERNLQGNFEKIILEWNQANRVEKHRKKKITKDRRIRKSICVKTITYGNSSWDISLFCTTGVLEASIAIILTWLRKQVKTCTKIEPKLILPFYRCCHHHCEKSKCTQSCRMFCTWSMLL